MIDETSQTWRTVQYHLSKRLATCREKNDSPDLTDAQTATLRGEIAALKDLLELPKMVAPVKVDDPGYGVDSIDD